MATVPELKAQAVRLGIKVPSAWRKADIENAIASYLEVKGAAVKAEQNRRRNASKNAETRTSETESEPREVSMPTEAERKAARAEAARLAGSRAKVTAPMDSEKREQGYRWQNAPRINGETVLSDKPLTDRQARRAHQKNNRQRGFAGCSLADYREMRKRMKRVTVS